MKPCTKCDEEKLDHEFYKNKLTPTGLSSWCKDCSKEWSRTQVQTGESLKHSRNRRVKRFNIDEAQYEKMALEQDNRCAICGTDSPGYRPSGNGNLTLGIDHDHTCCPGVGSCGKCIRALLCAKCNNGLGCFGDNIETMEKAIEYIKKWNNERLG